MQDEPVADETTRASHGFKPILPGESEELPSACAGCHTTLTTTDLELLVNNTQDVVRSRLTVALSRLGTVSEPQADSEVMPLYQQVVAALNFVQNDGSLGIHNYAYTDALLTQAEHDLSLLSVSGAESSPNRSPRANGDASGRDGNCAIQRTG